MITGFITTSVYTLVLKFSSICLSRPTLVLSSKKQKSRLNLKKCGTSGSLKLNRIFKFKLVGSNINWHSISSFCMILSNSMLFWLLSHSCLNSSNNIFLCSASPWQTEITWLILSSLPDKQILHRAEPPDWSDLIL